MSDKVFCAFCGAPIDVAEIATKRHVSQDTVRSEPTYCNKEHDNLSRKREGFFYRLSKAGNAVRSAKSKNPRRKKKVEAR